MSCLINAQYTVGIRGELCRVQLAFRKQIWKFSATKIRSFPKTSPLKFIIGSPYVWLLIGCIIVFYRYIILHFSYFIKMTGLLIFCQCWLYLDDKLLSAMFNLFPLTLVSALLIKLPSTFRMDAIRSKLLLKLDQLYIDYSCVGENDYIQLAGRG